MLKIDFSRKFLKLYKKAPVNIREAAANRLETFKSDQFNPLLNNHALTGIYQGHRSINVTGDWRIIFIETVDRAGKITVLVVTIGTHSQLYK